jgi:hypothetical protein
MMSRAEELSEEEMKAAEPLIPVFGMELVKKLFASDWHQRESAVQRIGEELVLGTKS